MSHTMLKAGLTVTPAGRYASVFWEMFHNLEEKTKAIQALKVMQETLDTSLDLRTWVISATSSLENRYDVLSAVCDVCVKHPGILPFLRLLCENNRVSLLPRILEVLDTHLLIERQEINVHVTSAVELSPKCRNQLEKTLNAYFSVQPRFFYRVDSSLLAGLVVRWGDTSINLSVQTRISDFMMLIKGANHAA